MKAALVLAVLAVWVVGGDAHLIHFWNPWGSWSSCNATCGLGTMARSRSCHIRCREEETDDETAIAVADPTSSTPPVVCSKGEIGRDFSDCFLRPCPASCTCYRQEGYHTKTGWLWGRKTVYRYRTVSYSCPCPGSRDVVAAIDGSGSISDQEFVELQGALARFLRGLGGHDWFGMVLYSTQVHLTVPLTVDHLQSNRSIASLPHPKGTTNTAAAIVEMHRLLKATGRGVVKVGVVFTDGASNDKAATIAAATAAKDDGVRICAIGIGSNVDQQELDQISSSSCTFTAPSYHVLQVSTMNSLAKTMLSIV